MLTIAHTMTSNAGLAGILLAVYQHGSLPQWWAFGNVTVCEDVEKDEDGGQERRQRWGQKQRQKASRRGCECSIV